ncbi:MAG TPA: hypothetical protein VFM93_09280 [Candidatus Limnocylindria bacterium]|nr:hypothetical protein [Candidatus Limnocylindria bacterium]
MRGSPGQFVRNVRRSPLPLGRRLALTLRNYARRFAALPPRDCCGRGGEPGC